MLDDGERLVPGFREARALRVWAGVRPLFQDARAGEVDRHARRQPHPRGRRPPRARRRRAGCLTMSGGKLTTLPADGPGHRRRDVRAARRASGRAGPRRSSRRATRTAQTYTLGSRLRRREATLLDEQLICECELIGRRRARGGDAPTRHDQPRRHPAQRCGSAWARARAASASTARPGSCTRSTGSTARRRPSRCATSSRSAGRACGRSSTATSCARRGSTTGSSRGCWTSSTCRTARCRRMSHHDVIVVGTGLAGLTAAVRLAEVGRARAACWRRASARRISAAARSTCSATRRSGSSARARRWRGSGRARPPVRARRRATASRPRSTWFKAGRRRLARAVRLHGRRSTRTCCCRRRSACPSRRRSCRVTMAGGDLRGGERGAASSGFRALKDFHPALLADELRARCRRRGARRSSSSCAPSGRADVNALGLRARVRRRRRSAATVIAQLGSPAARRRARWRSRRCSGIADPHEVWTRARGTARAAGVRGADAAAVGARHARVRDPARARCGAPAAA